MSDRSKTSRIDRLINYSKSDSEGKNKSKSESYEKLALQYY